jgi:DNA-binding phage protein
MRALQEKTHAHETLFSKRLNQLIERSFGGKWTRLAKAAGISPGSFTRYVSGEGKPTFDQIVRICEAGNARADWLLTGEGPMLREGHGKGEAMEDQQEGGTAGEIAALRGELAAKDKLIGYLEQDKERLEHQVKELRAALDGAKALQKTGSG